jgi:phosphosulfolactate phosphohydrolase-like enzyme
MLYYAAKQNPVFCDTAMVCMQIEVAILPQETTRLSSRVTFVIDVIRATTSLGMLLEQGTRSVSLAPDLDAAQVASEAP